MSDDRGFNHPLHVNLVNPVDDLAPPSVSHSYYSTISNLHRPPEGSRRSRGSRHRCSLQRLPPWLVSGNVGQATSTFGSLSLSVGVGWVF
jgi:hypothetical protein